jgi:WD40 repeat protein
MSPDGELLLLGREDGSAQVRKMSTGQPRGSPLRCRYPIGYAAFSPDGREILIFGYDASNDLSEARVCNVASSQPIGELLQSRGSILRANLGADGRLLVTVSRAKGAKLTDILVDAWDSRTGRRLEQTAGWQLRAVRPDGKAILFALPDQRLQLWDPIGGHPIGQPIDTQGHDRVLTFRPDGQAILVGGPGETARIWDLTGPSPIGEPLRDRNGFIAAVFSADGKVVATASRDVSLSIQCWDAATGRPIGARLPGNDTPVSFSPDGRILLTIHRGGTARRWEVETGRRILASDPAVLEIDGRALSGRAVLKNYGNGGVRLESLSNEMSQTLGPVLVHPSGISAHAVNLDGTIAVLGGFDGTVRVWDPVTGKPIGPPLAHPAPISGVAFYPKEEAIVVRCQDKSIHLWKLWAPVSGGVERVVAWVQVISGMDLDQSTMPRPLNASSHEQLRQRLDALGGPP